jgi:hypothetical protein
MECCHGDGNPRNNALGNLRWDTDQANQDDRVRHGRAPRGSKHPNAKLDEKQVQAIRTEYATGGTTQRAIAEKYGIDKDTVCLIVNRKVWKHV